MFTCGTRGGRGVQLSRFQFSKEREREREEPAYLSHLFLSLSVVVPFVPSILAAASSSHAAEGSKGVSGH